MSWLRAILREVFGLFVEDGNFALMILAWLALSAFLLPHLAWVPQWKGILLFVGLAAILMASAIRYTRRRKS